MPLLPRQPIDFPAHSIDLGHRSFQAGITIGVVFLPFDSRAHPALDCENGLLGAAKLPDDRAAFRAATRQDVSPSLSAFVVCFHSHVAFQSIGVSYPPNRVAGTVSWPVTPQFRGGDERPIMTDQPSLPEMPPMKAAQPQSVPPTPTQATRAPGGPRRLRQLAGYVAGGGFAIALTLGVGELTLKPGLRPSDVAATVEANVELGVMNQKMGQAPGQHVLNDAQYQEIIAKAQRDGAAKAEINYQRELADVQANKERVVGAYQTLYQRTNIIAQEGVKMESEALQFRQRLIEQTNGGRAVVISVYDGLCAFGDADSCEKARTARAGMIAESGALTEGDLARKVRELMAGIDDPATLIARENRSSSGVPALPNR